MGVTSVNSCQCKAQDTNVFAPLKGKMKVLKKIKRRMGIAPRSSGGCAGTNNLPPLLFHQVHGDNIRVSRDGTVARRAESFCKGVTFSARPVKINEKVCIKFIEISNNWSGVIRFGFTSNDPATLRYGLPKYACPDLTNKPGYWAKALAERFCERDTILFYYVTAAGDVHFGINGEEKGVFFSGVETRGPLWALIDVYGNSTAIEFVDIRQNLNNSRRSIISTGTCNSTPDEVERIILPGMQSINIQEEREIVTSALPPLRYQNPSLSFHPVPFHRTRGRNVRFSADRCVASRNDTDFCQGYVFTARPLQLGERIVVQILSTEPMYVGALALGLTSCDPMTLQQSDLPDDSDLLLDRPEYWVVSKDVASSPQRGDELSFCITVNGEVQISKNGGPSSIVMHVDQTLQLWAFLDVYGSTQKIRVLSCPPTPVHPQPSVSIESVPAEVRHSVKPQNSRVCCVASDLQNVSNGTVLVVNLPPTHANLINHQQQNAVSPSVTPHPHQGPHSSGHQAVAQHAGHHSHGVHAQTGSVSPPTVAQISPGTGTMWSTYSNTYIEPVSSSAYSTIQSRGDMPGIPAGVECTICYENPIDSVLYACGHMCMCYNCAIQQWRGKGGGHCPLCRAVIRDVIRTYKS